MLQQNKKQLLDTWMAEDKLECSEELGDMLQQVDPDMALRVWIKARANPKVGGSMLSPPPSSVAFFVGKWSTSRATFTMYAQRMKKKTNQPSMNL